MSDPDDREEAGRFAAEELAEELSREASDLAGMAEDDYGGAWRIAKERIGVLMQLGVVDGSGPGGVTFEEIVRLAEESSKRG